MECPQASLSVFLSLSRRMSAKVISVREPQGHSRSKTRTRKLTERDRESSDSEREREKVSGISVG